MRYNTQQKQMLVEFMKNNRTKSFTIDTIADEISVSKSTIYRLMTHLLSMGTVKKFTIENDRKSFYQFFEDCAENSYHLHMKCTNCGKILHMNDSASAHVLSDILEEENFTVDKDQTVLFGKCYECTKKES